MRHPYQTFAQLQLITMIITLILGAFALINTNLTIALITCFTLALSFTFEALVELKKQNTLQFGQQILRAIIIVVLVCFLYFS